MMISSRTISTRGLAGPALLLASALAVPAVGARGQDPGRSEGPDEAARRAIARALDESYPDRPEWVDMLADILQGSGMGPEDGWFRRAVAQTRFGWEPTRDRLDRDRDATLTESDFDFSAHALMSTPGTKLFYVTDVNGDGRLTREEFNALFDACDSYARGFLSLSDLQAPFRDPPPPPPGATPPPGPSKETLVRGLFRQEIGSLKPGPALDETAPDIALQTADGSQGVRLSGLVGPGRSSSSSATSPVARSAARRATSRNSSAATATARRSSWSTSARPTRPTAGGWRATTAWR